MCDKGVLENVVTIKLVPGYYKNQKCVMKLFSISQMH